MIDLPVWPLLDDPRDPWDDDPVLFDEAWKTHRRRDPLGGLSKEAFREALHVFEEALRANLAGELAFDDVFAVARPLGIAGLDEVDPRKPESPPELADASELARIGPNGHPDLGAEAPGRLLGPWEDAARHDRPLLRACLAEATFIERVRGEMSAWMRFRRRKPVPTVEERARVRPVSQAPIGVWTLTSTVEDGWRVADRVGLTPRWIPHGPVHLQSPVSVHGAEPEHGVTLVGRIVKTEAGWTVPMPFLVHGEPPKWLIDQEVQRILWRQSLVFPRVSRDEALANAGYSLIRRVHEWAWCRRA
ncbi:MAG: hypothetical protein EP330_02085 [Deltaproteobacteria bacterium]|nr:MAG: hypothetical protein EP330_02085 [Deltaproteobacteria bacterium]